MPMPPLPAPPLSAEIPCGEGRRIAELPRSRLTPPPGRVCGRSRGVPFTGIRPAFEYPPPACPVLVLVLVADGDSRRWRDGDPAAEIARLRILQARGDNQPKRNGKHLAN